MKPKTLMLLTVAGGCGLVAMLAVQQAMQANSGPEVEKVQVLVALEAIETGVMLTKDKVAFQERTIDTVPEDAVLSEEQFQQRGARVPLFTGDIVTMSKLTEPGGIGNSMKIPKGMRVVTIPVRETDSHSNLLAPGDRVDVIVTYQSRKSRGPAVTKTKTLLEYVEILATGNHTEDQFQGEARSANTKHVSLLLMPDQVNYVKLAQSKGSLSLAWRHRLDDEFVAIKDIDEELLEELEGSMGINEARPLFDLDPDPLMMQDRPTSGLNLEVVADKNPEPAELESVQSLLASVQQEDTQTTPPAPITTPVADQNPATVEPEPQPEPEVKKPTWTIQVYDGKNSIPHQFELEGQVEEQAELEQSQSTGSLADTVRSLWGSSESSTELPTPEVEALK